jgi:hypothetical protein
VPSCTSARSCGWSGDGQVCIFATVELRKGSLEAATSSAHLDLFGYRATCNATSLAMWLEYARVKDVQKTLHPRRQQHTVRQARQERSKIWKGFCNC